MSAGVPASLERRVRSRAGNRCEYCRIGQDGQEATFHVDHVNPRRAGGATHLDDLALACISCSLRKGARVQGRDSSSGTLAGIFDPRRDRWDEHFQVQPDCVILGKSPTGRVTIEMRNMNRPVAIAIRHEEAEAGRYPG